MKPFRKYCGPYWSAGKFQRSVVSDVPAVDRLDQLCKEHDAVYATGGDLKQADAVFAREAISHGGIGVLYGAAVGLQGLLRANDKSTYRSPNMKNKQNKSLRGSASSGAASGAVKKLTRNDMVGSAPVAFATKRSGAAPRMRTRGDGVVEITHRSFLQPVNNNATFEVQGIPCNPGMSGSFPWLSKLARRYEEYRFKHLRYEYRSVAPSSAPGVIMMSFDYDAADEAPAAKAIQAQTIPNSEANVWVNNDLIVSPTPEFKFVRAGNLAANLDVKTYDMGRMWLSSAYGNGQIGGELYVEYTVELRKPSYGSEVSGTLQFATTVAAAPFSGTPVITGVANPFAKETNARLGVIAGGEYLVTISALGTATLTGGPTGLSISSIGDSVAVELAATVTATNATTTYKMRLLSGDSINLTTAATGSGLTGVYIRVATIDFSSM